MSGEDELSDDDQRLLADLKQRDQEVRAHEQAHQSQGSGLAGSASFTYQQGPDGQRYAIGGEVPIDTAPVPNDAEATVTKMQTVRRAALAPANPSGPDIQIAGRATQLEQKARASLAQQRYSEVKQLGNTRPTESAIAAA